MMNGSVAFSLLKRAENHVVTSPHILRSKHNKRHHTFSTNTKQGIQPKDENYRSPLFVAVAAVTVAVAVASASLYTRHLREQKLSTLVEAKDSELLSTDTTTTNTISSTLSSSPIYNLPSLIETVTRAGLIGSTKSVKDELHVLRDWHTSRGYNGGIVVRDLSRPLFSLNLFDFGHETNNDESEEDINGDDKESFDGISNIADHIMNRRECYYLYYEIHSNGETRQQLFCRGTTLLADVLTCLQTWFVYDEELGCRVHHGFNQHANRIVEDVMPLLVPPPPTINNGTTAETMGRNYAATVEVCGHSLGGAVAMLVAIKLRKRGYFVTRVTSLAGPRFCRVRRRFVHLSTVHVAFVSHFSSASPILTYRVQRKGIYCRSGSLKRLFG